jgi:hypothetical protein
LLLGALPCLALPACQGLGPPTLGAGRAAYNDVIARTNAEQMLALIVRLRYADPIGLITVSNVTASLRFGATAGSEVGIGAQSNYAGNLVPFSAGVVYEDNPTIAYTPVDAQQFLRAWLRPLRLSIVVPAMQSAPRLDTFLPMLVERLNGLRSEPSATASERAKFARATSLLGVLRDGGVASWVDVSKRGEAARYELILAGYAPTRTAEVVDLLRLLSITGDTLRGAPIRIPIEAGVRLQGTADLFVQTRSVSEILSAAAALVEVPEEHVEAGVVSPNIKGPSEEAPALRIHSSRRAPRHANVAVKVRDWWYYVDDTDLAAKRAFQAIQILFVSELTEAARGGQRAPVLTIPVR